MTARNDYKIRLTADASGVKAGVNAAKGELGSIAASANELAGKLGGIFAGVSIGAFAGKLVSVQREFDVLNSSLITVTGSSSAAAREMAWIKEFAASTPYALNEVTQAFIRMKSLGLDATEGALNSYANTASAMGRSLDQMIEAVADASTGEFERLKEFGIKAKQQGDQVTLTFRGVATTIGKNADEITEYLRKIGDTDFAGANAERAKTLDGAISNLGDSWDELFRTINQNNAGGLIYDSVKLASGAIADAIDILNAMNRATADNARETGAMAVVQDGLATVFEAVTVYGINVAYVLRGIGTELGGLAAQAAAVARLDFAAAGEIGRLMKEDAAAARAAVDAQSAAILNARTNADEFRSVVAAARKGTADYGTTVGRLIELQNAGKISAQDFRTAVESMQPAAQKTDKPVVTLTRNLGGTKKAAKEAKDEIAELLAKLQAKEIEEAAKAVDDYNAAWRDYLGGLYDTARGLDEQLELYGLTEAQIAQVTLRRAEERLEMARMSGGVSAEYLAALEQEVKLRREIAESAGQLEVRKANAEAADQAAQDWQRTAEAIEDALIDALMEGGKSGAEYIEGLFRTMVLRPIVQAIVQPIAGSLTNAMGFGAPGQGSSGGSFGLPPGLGTTGLISSGIQWAGAALGSSAIGSFGAGMAMTSSQIAGLSGAGLISGGAATAGATVAAAMPYIGAALFAAQAMGLFDKKPSDKTSWASYDPSTGRTFDIGDMGGKKAASQEQKDATTALAMLTGNFANLAGIDASVTAMMGGRDGTRLKINRDEGTHGFLTPLGTVANGNNSLNYGSGEDAIKLMLDDLIDEGTLPQETIDRWKALKTNVDGSARDAVELVDVLALINQELTDTEILRADLIQVEGETLGQAATRIKDMMAAFEPITADEAWTKATRALADEFGKLGQAMPQTATEFARVVNALDLTTDAGQDAYRAMTSLAPAFLQLSSVVDEVFASISKTTAESVRDIQLAVLDNAGKYAFLDSEIDVLLEKLSASTDPATVQGLFEQINSKTTQAFNLLDESEQKRLAGEFVDRLYEAEALAQQRLSVAPLDYQPQIEVAQAQQQAAQKQSEAADAQKEAASAIRDAALRMAAAAGRIEAGTASAGSTSGLSDLADALRALRPAEVGY